MKRAFSPNPKVYSFGGPTALNREVVTDNQVRWDEETIRWGGDQNDDSFPMRLLMAVNQSPTATSCLNTLESFTKGAAFDDEALMSHPIDSQGTTLWDFHCRICEYFSKLDSYSVNFKFNQNNKITSAYPVGVETVRFVRPANEKSSKINEVKVNPYFGTAEYDTKFTAKYPVFNLETVKEEINLLGKDYPGQIYFFGTVKPPYKFYPVPQYWSGKQWIYVDGNIQEFHKNNLENGFFQSALINMIGNPNQMSSNPKFQEEYLDSNSVKRKRSTKTIGQEFDMQMSNAFSGARKAGTAMVLWSLNKDQAINVHAFPVNSNFDILSGTLTDSMRGITTATGVPAILANLPQQTSSLGSDGNAIRAAIDLMQSRVSWRQQNLENFYNTVLLHNHFNKTTAKVKIKNFVPITTQITVDDKFFEVLQPEEKREFIKTNVPGFEQLELFPVETTPQQDTEEEKQLNKTLTNLSGRQQIQLNRIARQYDRKQITPDQARLQLKNGFGFSDQDVNIWLGEETAQ